MRVRLKEVLFRTSLLGGIFSCFISSSFGMELTEEGAEFKKIKLKHRITPSYRRQSAGEAVEPEVGRPKRKRITSLSTLERQLKESGQKGRTAASLASLQELQSESQSISPQGADEWIDKGQGDLTDFYHLGRLADQLEKDKKSYFEEDESCLLTIKKAKAFYWYKRARDQEDGEAQREMGLIYLKGSGVAKDYNKAFECFYKAPGAIDGSEFFDCGLMDANASQVAALFSKVSHLTVVNLAQNKFTSQGLVEILNSLHSHIYLAELNMSHNLIDDEGGKTLLQFFKKKNSLKVLMTYGNPLNEEIEILLNKMINFRLDSYFIGVQ